MTRRKSQANKRKEKSSSIIKEPRLVRVGNTWQRKEIKEVNIIENKPNRLVKDGNVWKRIVPSKNENVSPRQNIFELILPHEKDTKVMRSSNLESLNGESESLKRMFDLIDDENLPSNESLKKFKFSIENNLYRYKLSQNTFLPVGFQLAEEILGYLDVEDLISVSLTYKPIHKFITNSEKLWQELYKELSPGSISSIMKPLIMIQSLASPELKPSVAWKRQVFNRLKYRPFYLAFTYLDDPNDFTISFPGVSYDLSTVHIEAYQYAIYEEETFSPANFVQHKTQIFDSLQEGFDEWRIAIEPIKTELTKPLKLKDNDELFIVYNYMDVNSIFQFNFLKLFDNVNEAIKFAESLSDLNDDDDYYIKNINHSGKIFDCKQKFIKDSRIAIDIVKFWSKIHQNRNLPNSFIEDDIKGKGKEKEEIEEEEDTDDDTNDSTNFIEKWRQMGLMDKTYIQEVIDDIINKTNQKKRSFKDSMLDMELGEPSSSRKFKRKK